MERKTETITRVRFAGKWVELWFASGAADGKFHECAKSERLWDAIHQAGLYDDVINHGLAGRQLIFERVGVNWEIRCFDRTLEPCTVEPTP